MSTDQWSNQFLAVGSVRNYSMHISIKIFKFSQSFSIQFLLYSVKVEWMGKSMMTTC